jgi:hypothetical protein
MQAGVTPMASMTLRSVTVSLFPLSISIYTFLLQISLYQVCVVAGSQSDGVQYHRFLDGRPSKQTLLKDFVLATSLATRSQQCLGVSSGIPLRPYMAQQFASVCCLRVHKGSCIVHAIGNNKLSQFECLLAVSGGSTSIIRSVSDRASPGREIDARVLSGRPTDCG